MSFLIKAPKSHQLVPSFCAITKPCCAMEHSTFEYPRSWRLKRLGGSSTPSPPCPCTNVLYKSFKAWSKAPWKQWKASSWLQWALNKALEAGWLCGLVYIPTIKEAYGLNAVSYSAMPIFPKCSSESLFYYFIPARVYNMHTFPALCDKPPNLPRLLWATSLLLQDVVVGMTL